MSCPLCASLNQAEFSAEMIIHFIGSNLDNPGVMTRPQIFVCMDCGASRFTITEAQRQRLREGIAGSISAAA